MPQAHPALVLKLQGYFKVTEHSSLEASSIKYLKEQGYIEERFQWHPKEGVVTVDDMTPQEADCMWYLVTEWDWGGLIKPADQKETS